MPRHATGKTIGHHDHCKEIKVIELELCFNFLNGRIVKNTHINDRWH